jgi:hypothetical protein
MNKQGSMYRQTFLLTELQKTQTLQIRCLHRKPCLVLRTPALQRLSAYRCQAPSPLLLFLIDHQDRKNLYKDMFSHLL